MDMFRSIFWRHSQVAIPVDIMFRADESIFDPFGRGSKQLAASQNFSDLAPTAGNCSTSLVEGFCFFGCVNGFDSAWLSRGGSIALEQLSSSSTWGPGWFIGPWELESLCTKWVIESLRSEFAFLFLVDPYVFPYEEDTAGSMHQIAVFPPR